MLVNKLHTNPPSPNKGSCYEAWEGECTSNTSESKVNPIENLNTHVSCAWKIVSVPASEIDSDSSPWLQLRLSQGFYRIGKCNDATWEAVIDLTCLARLDFLFHRINLEYNPTRWVKSSFSKARNALDGWLQRAAATVCSDLPQGVKNAYYDHAQAESLAINLQRAVLIYTIETSPALVQDNLEGWLQRLYLILENHRLSDVTDMFKGGYGELLERVKANLTSPIGDMDIRTEDEELQLLSIVQTLGELAGLSSGYPPISRLCTGTHIIKLCASLLNIKEPLQFGAIDYMAISNIIGMSPLFTDEAVQLEGLKKDIVILRESLLGFPEDYLDLPIEILNQTPLWKIDAFNNHLAYTYWFQPKLQRELHGIRAFLVWNTRRIADGADSGHEYHDLCQWAASEDGKALYKQMITDAQTPVDPEQLILTIAAIIAYLHLLPDRSDNLDEPIGWGFLDDLDKLYHGHDLGNSGTVAKRMGFSLLRTCHSERRLEAVSSILEEATGKAYPPLHLYDGFSDQYMRLMVELLNYEAALASVNQNIVHSKEPAKNRCQTQRSIPLEIDLTHTVNTTVEEANKEISTKPYTKAQTFVASSFTLIRVSNVEDQSRLESLLEMCKEPDEESNLEALIDGSFEICILKSNLTRFRDTLATKSSSAIVNIAWDPLQPTSKDLEQQSFITAKEMLRDFFFYRATKILYKGLSGVASHYSDLIKVMCGLSMVGELVATFRGFVADKRDAEYLVSACTSGKLSHACRQPRDGEAPLSGNVFVWESGSMGSDAWDDGLQWEIQEEGERKVSRALDGSGLLRAEIDVFDSGHLHHVLSYYAALDACCLVRPSSFLSYNH